MGDNSNLRRLKTISASVPEADRIRIDDVIKRFQSNCKIKDFTFPPNLSSQARAYVHAQAGQIGLKSQSSGNGQNRRVTLSKPMGNNRKILKTLELSSLSISKIQALETLRLEQRNVPAIEPSKKFHYMEEERHKFPPERTGFTNRLFTQPSPKVPKPRQPTPLDTGRNRLPIMEFKDEILNTMRKRSVTFIKGDTGCGKTTQVPQFILDDATDRREKVRILCTVPRRIAAISISDRVAAERGERLGFTVGYQIRLQSCISPCETLLTYCTSGVLLRSLTSFDYSILKHTTHIIIDEIHERDRQTEFLLACIRDVGREFPHLKLILMGADMDTDLMTTYFGGNSRCPIIEVHGRLFPVNILYLEDVLALLQYEVDDSSRNRKASERSQIFDNLVESLSTLELNENVAAGCCNNKDQEEILKKIEEQEKHSNAIKHDVASLIKRTWTTGDVAATKKFLDLVDNEIINVNFQPNNTHPTMLMSGAVRGDAELVSKLLELGADPSIYIYLPAYDKVFYASDWALDHHHDHIAELIERHKYQKSLVRPTESRTMSQDAEIRLRRYQNSVDSDRVDLQLIVKLLYYVHINADTSEAVLIFLPGYDEIVTLKQMIFSDRDLGNLSNDLVVFLLHSNIQSGDHKAVFERPRNNKRKIVLSTNIAETSLTIEDVVYVLDSGKVKEKTFDSLTGVTQLKSNWISQASANQRQGRAGRCRKGTCYRLYSFARYESMNVFPVAEIVRSSLQELCLYTRSFIRKELKIKDFFQRLPEPPAPIAVKKSVDALISMGALDEQEQLTKLGLYLLDLPIEPYLGKALMHAVTLKCLDPVLTIVSLVSYREPFQLPANADDKKKALQSKFEFSEGTMSDHMANLKAFQEWEKSTLFKDNVQKRFCRERYLSAACFEMVYGIRSQLLGQLRAAGFVQNSGPGDLKDINCNSENWSLVKGILTATMFPNVCAVDRENKCLYNEFDTKIKIHSTSTVIMNRPDGIAGIPTDWIIFDEMCQQDFTKCIRSCTIVSDIPIALFGGKFTDAPYAYDGGLCADMDSEAYSDETKVRVEQSERFDLNNWISFRGNKMVIESLLYLRGRLQELMIKRLECPPYIASTEDESVIKTIAEVLATEDEERGLLQVQGISQWPKLVSGNIMSMPRNGFQRSQAVSEDDKDMPKPLIL